MAAAWWMRPTCGSWRPTSATACLQPTPLAGLDGNGEVNVVDLSMVAVLLGRQTGIFPDANLEAAVREALGLPEGDITP